MKIGRFSLNSGDGNGQDEYDDPPRPFIEHLIDLRDCLMRCALSWALCVVGIIPFAPTITRWLLEPAKGASAMVQGLTWTAGFDILFKIMLWGGTALSLPFLFFFLSRFIFPGLKKSERSIIMFCLLTSTVLFLGGVWMAYSATLSVAFDVLQKVNQWMGIKVEILTWSEHISIVMKTIIAFGIAFQLPLLLLVLGWIGMISSKALAEKRRIAIVVIFILAMVLTPPDPVSQIVMAIPMCVLYEICILLIKLREIARGKKEEGDTQSDSKDSKEERKDGEEG